MWAGTGGDQPPKERCLETQGLQGRSQQGCPRIPAHDQAPVHTHCLEYSGRLWMGDLHPALSVRCAKPRGCMAACGLDVHRPAGLQQICCESGFDVQIHRKFEVA